MKNCNRFYGNVICQRKVPFPFGEAAVMVPIFAIENMPHFDIQIGKNIIKSIYKKSNMCYIIGKKERS